MSLLNIGGDKNDKSYRYVRALSLSFFLHPISVGL